MELEREMKVGESGVWNARVLVRETSNGSVVIKEESNADTNKLQWPELVRSQVDPESLLSDSNL